MTPLSQSNAESDVEQSSFSLTTTQFTSRVGRWARRGGTSKQRAKQRAKILKKLAKADRRLVDLKDSMIARGEESEYIITGRFPAKPSLHPDKMVFYVKSYWTPALKQGGYGVAYRPDVSGDWRGSAITVEALHKRGHGDDIELQGIHTALKKAQDTAEGATVLKDVFVCYTNSSALTIMERMRPNIDTEVDDTKSGVELSDEMIDIINIVGKLKDLGVTVKLVLIPSYVQQLEGFFFADRLALHGLVKAQNMSDEPMLSFWLELWGRHVEQKQTRKLVFRYMRMFVRNTRAQGDLIIHYSPKTSSGISRLELARPVQPDRREMMVTSDIWQAFIIGL